MRVCRQLNTSTASKTSSVQRNSLLCWNQILLVVTAMTKVTIQNYRTAVYLSVIQLSAIQVDDRVTSRIQRSPCTIIKCMH